MAAVMDTGSRRRPRSLAQELVEVLGGRIRDGLLRVGDKLPTEAAIVGEFGVSRTVVREAISKLQAAGLVQTRHGIGTFVAEPSGASSFRIDAEQLATLNDVVAVLELRIAVESEAAALAAERRTADELVRMRMALEEFGLAVEEGRDSVSADYQFHLEVARATHNLHYTGLMGTLGTMMIPRSRLDPALPASDERRRYLRGVNAEHERIYDAIAKQDPVAARKAMRQHLSNSAERRRRAAVGAGH